MIFGGNRNQAKVTPRNIYSDCSKSPKASHTCWRTSTVRKLQLLIKRSSKIANLCRKNGPDITRGLIGSLGTRLCTKGLTIDQVRDAVLIWRNLCHCWTIIICASREQTKNYSGLETYMKQTWNRHEIDIQHNITEQSASTNPKNQRKP